MGKAVKTDIEYKEILEKSLSAIQYLRMHGFSTYMESEGIVNRIMMFKDKNEMRDQKTQINSVGLAMIAEEYKCIDAYKKPENPMEWLPCPRCGLRPLVWEFDNGRATACGCGTDCYSHWSVQAESIMSVIKRSDNGKSAEAYDIDELKNNWNHWVRTGEILFTPGNGRW
jgi:hypothetical protein